MLYFFKDTPDANSRACMYSVTVKYSESTKSMCGVLEPSSA